MVIQNPNFGPKNIVLTLTCLLDWLGYIPDYVFWFERISEIRPLLEPDIDNAPHEI